VFHSFYKKSPCILKRFVQNPSVLQKNKVFLCACTYGAAQRFASKKRRFFVRFASKKRRFFVRFASKKRRFFDNLTGFETPFFVRFSIKVFEEDRFACTKQKLRFFEEKRKLEPLWGSIKRLCRLQRF
jgi:hypothetical protein